jgi:polyferredoxin
MKCPRCTSTKNKVVIARIVPVTVKGYESAPNIILCTRCLIALDAKRERVRKTNRKLKHDDYYDIAIDFMTKRELITT